MQSLISKQSLRYIIGALVLYTMLSLMVALPAMAQTSTTTMDGTTIGTTTATTTPGVPVTGVGGDTATNTIILVASLVIAAVALVYIVRRTV
jgi:hypothetical protein